MKAHRVLGLHEIGEELRLALEVARGGSIAGVQPEYSAGAALTTVIAARGYPETPETGQRITIPDWVDDSHDVLVFHAGTRKAGDHLESSGGRVLSVTGRGETLAQAQQHSLRAAEAITFEGKYFRRDIGWRELQRHA